MSNDKTVVQRNGVSAMGLLGVVFVTLKLLGIAPVAAWSWWMVTLPFWGGLALIFAIFLIAALIVGVAKMFSK